MGLFSIFSVLEQDKAEKDGDVVPEERKDPAEELLARMNEGDFLSKEEFDAFCESYTKQKTDFFDEVARKKAALADLEDHVDEPVIQPPATQKVPWRKLQAQRHVARNGNTITKVHLRSRDLKPRHRARVDPKDKRFQ